jgi:hypothetical protein
VDEAEVRCALTAESQHGAFHHVQALEAGMSDWVIYRRLELGLWRQVHPRIYCDAATPLKWKGKLSAALLWAGPKSAVSHRAAARLHALERFNAPFVELTSIERVRKRKQVIVHSSNDLPPHKLTTIDGLRVTNVERTLLDVCAVGKRHAAEAALDGAIRRKKTSLRDLTYLFVREARQGRRGIRMMRGFLEDRGQGQPIRDSDLHREFVQFLVRNGIGGFDEYHPVRDETGFFVEIDVAFPKIELGFEVDGYDAHGGRPAFDHDRKRERKLTVRGWTIIRVTKSDLRNPEDLIADIRALLRDR